MNRSTRALALSLAAAAWLVAPMTADAGVISFSSNRCEPGVEETVADWGPMGCRSGIWLIDDDGTDLRNLTGGDNTPNEDDVTEEGPIGVAVVGLSGPAISPDGKHFVATKNILPAGQPRLFTTDLTGGGQRLLSPPLAPDACPPEPQWCAAEYNLQDEQPDWSPNGRLRVEPGGFRLRQTARSVRAGRPDG
jgi:hypothetical protein